MAEPLDYHDIQGNIMVYYQQFGYLKARYLFLKINNVYGGQKFVRGVQRFITPASQWLSKNPELPKATTNISFTYNGLKKLGLPTLTMQSFPDEFIMGMRGRRTILGDEGHSDPENWDVIWHHDVHIFISIDAVDEENREKRYDEINELILTNQGVELMDGHRSMDKGKTLEYQDASALYDENGHPTDKEHFGYSDGISNPFFKGMTADMGNLIGGGKKNRSKFGYGNPELESTWAPLETGEFILGYEDEAREYPEAPTPPLLARNGSFMVYNKFHENVGKFNHYLETEGANFPGGKEALAAKFVGRWRNGAPVTSFPTLQRAEIAAQKRQQAINQINEAATAGDAKEFEKARADFREINKKFIGFDYDDDISGAKCPLGAHTRRANPRGALEFGTKKAFDTPSALADRRRIIRRGLPYGIAKDPSSNDGEHGTIIMTIVASIKRQFEFVIQQWINYGNDFRLANDKDPILGNHTEKDGVGNGRMVIQGDQNNPPHFLSKIPLFVETRGGEYFFIPSLTALRMIGEGIVDPT